MKSLGMIVTVLKEEKNALSTLLKTTRSLKSEPIKIQEFL